MRINWRLLIAFCLIALTLQANAAFVHAQKAVGLSSYQTLFDDDFTQGLGKWSQIQGTWAVSKGELQGTSNQGMGMITAGDTSWGDYIFTLESRSLTGSPISVLVRLLDAANYYKIILTSNHFEFWLVRGGTPTLLYRESDAYEIDLKQVSDMKVKILGAVPTISLYLYGYPEITVKDLSGESISQGKIGFAVDPGSSSVFRNVKVTTMHAALVGPQRVILLLVEYPDWKHTLTPQQAYANVFPTLNQYYTEVSYNQTWIVGQVTPVWKTLPNPSTYYDLSTVVSSGWGKGRDVAFLHDAIAAWDKEIDFRKYDYIFVAGAGDSVWGYTDFQVPIITTDDGVVVTGATAQRETYTWTVYAHEFGHLALGLPDLYSYQIAFKGPADYRVAAIYAGPWDLMSRSNDRPEIGAWGKIHSGWITEDHVLELLPGQEGTAAVQPLETPTDGIQAVIVYITATTYFIIENRQPLGFDKVLPDNGILISYVDEAKYWHGNGPVVVQNAHPESGPRWQLPHPTFNLGPDAVSQYTNQTYKISVDLLDKLSDAYIAAFGKPEDMPTAKTAYQHARDLLQQAAQLLDSTSNYQSPEAVSIASQARQKYAIANDQLTKGSLGFFNQTITTATDSVNMLQNAAKTEDQYLKSQTPQTQTPLIAAPIIAVIAIAAILFAYRRRKKLPLKP